MIVDNAFVTEKDAKTTFFLDANRINETKAQQMCEFLQELNEDVKGEYLINVDEKYVNDKCCSPFIDSGINFGT